MRLWTAGGKRSRAGRIISMFVVLTMGLLLTPVRVAGQSDIHLANGTVLRNVRVVAPDWSQKHIRYTASGVEKRIRSARVHKIETGGGEALFNDVWFKGRRAENLRVYGRPFPSSFRVGVGYSLTGAAPSLAYMLAHNGLEAYQRQGGLFGVYRPTGGPTVSESKGVGLTYERWLSAKDFLFFVGYHHHQYLLQASLESGSGFVSSLYPNIRYQYNQHYVVLGFGRGVPLPVLRTELRLKAGLVMLGTRLADKRYVNVVGTTQSLTVKPLKAGILAEADLKLFETANVETFLSGRYFGVAGSEVEGRFYDSSAPPFSWKKSRVSNNRLWLGLSAGLRF